MAVFYVRKQLLARSLSQYSGTQAREKMKSGSILLDVRTARERSSVSLPNSIHIPLHELSSRMKELEKYKGKEIICYCASGARSVNAGIKLKKAGFTVGNLTGGIATWNY
ncbi:MAG: rhodanese-like domain-containing protein [Bacteroidetes bacterium]|nr:rhodanese-like domain-containing protein [Bacteroidota bacterium]